MLSQARRGIAKLHIQYTSDMQPLVPSSTRAASIWPRRNSNLRVAIDNLHGSYKETDLSRPVGFSRAMVLLKEHKPRRVDFSPPCDCSHIPVDGEPQQDNSGSVRDPKSEKTQKILKNSVLLAQNAFELGLIIDFEQPARSRSWGFRPLRHLRSQLHEVRVSGCAYGMTTATATL